MINRLLIFIFTLACATSANSKTPAAPAPLEVRGASFDFGHVPFGSTVKHRITLLNHGSELIKITRVNPGCGCTQIPLTKREIAPGDSAEIDLILDTSKIKTGLFHKVPMIFTDNLAIPRISVTLTGYNLGADERGPRIKVTPLSLEWRVKQDARPLVLQITNGSNEEVRTRVISAPAPEIIEPTFPRKLIRAGGIDSILVEIPALAGQPALVQESLTFCFNDNRQTRFTIPITIIR